MQFKKTAVFRTRVEFEDVDQGGVVHHPNYLKYYERARGYASEQVGLFYGDMLRDGVAVAVSEAHLHYDKPLFYGQQLYVLSRMVAVRKTNFKLIQAILTVEPSPEELEKAGDRLDTLGNLANWAYFRMVYVQLKPLRPLPIPPSIRDLLGIPDESTLSTESRNVYI